MCVYFCARACAHACAWCISVYVNKYLYVYLMHICFFVIVCITLKHIIWSFLRVNKYFQDKKLYFCVVRWRPYWICQIWGFILKRLKFWPYIWTQKALLLMIIGIKTIVYKKCSKTFKIQLLPIADIFDFASVSKRRRAQISSLVNF